MFGSIDKEGLVGVRRFELRASASQTQRSARLSYTPGPRSTLGRQRVHVNASECGGAPERGKGSA